MINDDKNKVFSVIDRMINPANSDNSCYISKGYSSEGKEVKPSAGQSPSISKECYRVKSK